jgi:hypothetical protein
LGPARRAFLSALLSLLRARTPSSWFGLREGFAFAVYGVDVLVAPGAEAQVVETGTVLVKNAVALVCGRAANQNAGPAADAVDHVVGAKQGLHLEKVAELFPKGDATLRVVHRQLDVRNPVGSNRHEGLLALKRRGETIR